MTKLISTEDVKSELFKSLKLTCEKYLKKSYFNSIKLDDSATNRINYHECQITYSNAILNGIPISKPQFLHPQINSMLSRLYIELGSFFLEINIHSIEFKLIIICCSESKNLGLYLQRIDLKLKSDRDLDLDQSKRQDSKINYFMKKMRFFYHFFQSTYSSSRLVLISCQFFNSISGDNNDKVFNKSYHIGSKNLISSFLGFERVLEPGVIFAKDRDYIYCLLKRLSDLIGYSTDNFDHTVYCLNDYESSLSLILAKCDLNLIIDNTFNICIKQTIDLLEKNNLLNKLKAVVKNLEDFNAEFMDKTTDNFFDKNIDVDNKLIADNFAIKNPTVLICPYGSILYNKTFSRLKNILSNDTSFLWSDYKLKIDPQIIILTYINFFNADDFAELIKNNIEFLAQKNYYLAQIDCINFAKFYNNYSFFNIDFKKLVKNNLVDEYPKFSKLDDNFNVHLSYIMVFVKN